MEDKSVVLRTAQTTMVADLVLEAAHQLSFRIVHRIHQQVGTVGEAGLALQVARGIGTKGK